MGPHRRLASFGESNHVIWRPPRASSARFFNARSLLVRSPVLRSHARCGRRRAGLAPLAQADWFSISLLLVFVDDVPHARANAALFEFVEVDSMDARILIFVLDLRPPVADVDVHALE